MLVVSSKKSIMHPPQRSYKIYIVYNHPNGTHFCNVWQSYSLVHYFIYTTPYNMQVIYTVKHSENSLKNSLKKLRNIQISNSHTTFYQWFFTYMQTSRLIPSIVTEESTKECENLYIFGSGEQTNRQICMP